MARERAKIGVGMQWHAGVSVPDQGVAVQRRRPRQLIHAQSPPAYPSRPDTAVSIRAWRGKSSSLAQSC